MKKRFTEEQIVRMLREAEASGLQVREFCRKQNITRADVLPLAQQVRRGWMCPTPAG